VAAALGGAPRPPHRLALFGYLTDLERLFDEVPALQAMDLEVAFLDLAGFGTWNNKFGMAAGDDVLRFLALELRRIPDAIAVRDGGDEFFVVSAPGMGGLVERMDSFRLEFVPRFHAEFGEAAVPVAARVVTTVARGRELIEGRDRLGKAIAGLNRRYPHPGPEGVGAAIEPPSPVPIGPGQRSVAPLPSSRPLGYGADHGHRPVVWRF
jgi:GGDEF domain-containing protein